MPIRPTPVSIPSTTTTVTGRSVPTTTTTITPTTTPTTPTTPTLTAPTPPLPPTTTATTTTATTAGTTTPVATIPRGGQPGSASVSVAAPTKQPDMTRTYVTGLSGDVGLTRGTDGAWSRGWIIPTVEAQPGGKMRITVESGHKTKDDQVTLTLQARVRAPVPDPQNPGQTKLEERTIELEVLHEGPLNKGTHDHVAQFDVDLKQLQAHLKQIAPNANLVLDGATPLAVAAKWKASTSSDWDHQWGGWDRNGSFYLPYAGVTMNGTTTGGATTGGNTDAIGGAMPLDIGVTLTDDLVNRYKGTADGQSAAVLLGGGQFMSRVESEVKVAVPFDKGQALAKQVFELVQLTSDPTAAKKKAEELFGKGWSLNIDDVKRFYTQDKDGAFVVDPKTQLPVVTPMIDRYMDSQDGQLAAKGIALRFRETPKDPHGLVNIKLPSPASLPNPTNLSGLIGRYDTGIQTVKGVKNNPQQLASFFNSQENLNAFRHVRDLVPGLKAESVLQPAMDQFANRYKIILEHDNGTSIELSLDHVTAVALDPRGNVRKGADGKPMVATYWQLELDLEHLQTSSTNVVSQNGGSSTSSVQRFSDASQQQSWLATLGAGATLGGPPRVHKPEDVKNPSIIESDAYKLLLDVGPKLHGWLLAAGAVPASQKYAMAARLTGIVAMEPSMAASFAREVDVSAKLKEAYAQTYQATETQVDAVKADALAKGTALTTGFAGLKGAYSQLGSQLYTLSSQVDFQWNARNTPQPQTVTTTTPPTRFEQAVTAWQTARAKVDDGLALYDQAATGAGLDANDERALIATLDAAYGEVHKAQQARLDLWTQHTAESDPAKKAALKAEAEGGATTSVATAKAGLQAAVGALTQQTALRAKKALLLTRADADATRLRSGTLLQTLQNTPV